MRHLGNAINKMLYIGTQITEKTYGKSSHIVIARQLRSLNKKESHNSYALSNYEFKYSSILVVLYLILLSLAIIKLRGLPGLESQKINLFNSFSNNNYSRVFSEILNAIP